MMDTVPGILYAVVSYWIDALQERYSVVLRIPGTILYVLRCIVYQVHLQYAVCLSL